VWISLLCFIPVVGVVMMFVLGAKGKEWAWEAGSWRSIEDFQRTQHNWSIAAGIYILVAFIIPIILGMAVTCSTAVVG